MDVTLGDGLWRVLVFVLLGLALLSLRVWDVRSAKALPPGVEVKTYPPGCSCIRGALVDNPRCPHHGELG